MVNQNLINYINQQLAKGYSEEQVRNYLISQGYKKDDVEEAIKNKNLTGLEEYIKQQMTLGYDLNSIKNFLMQRGYTSEIIDKSISNLQHEKGPSRKILIIVFLIFIGLAFIGGIVYFMVNSGLEIDQYISPTHTNSVTSTTIIYSPITIKTGVSTTKLSSTSTTKTEQTNEQSTTTSEELVTTTSLIFSPENAPINKILDYVRISGINNPQEVQDYCNRVPKNNMKDLCFNELAQTNNDKIYCTDIKEAKRKDNCYLSLNACEDIVQENLKRACRIAKKTSFKETPQFEDIPKIQINMNDEYPLDLEQFLNVNDVTVNYSNNNRVKIKITGLVANLIPDRNWTGNEIIRLIACKEEECDSKDVEINVEKLNGFKISPIEELMMFKNRGIMLNLGKYLQINESISWKASPSNNLVSMFSGNSLYLNAQNNFIGKETITLTGCIGNDCDSKILSVNIIEENILIFNIPEPEKKIILNKNQNYEFILKDFVNNKTATFNNSVAQNMKISIDTNTKTTIIPNQDWIGEETVTFWSCLGNYLCKNQSIFVKVI